MKKVLNIEAITNELEGASLFFSRPGAPTKSKDEAATPLSDSPSVQSFIAASSKDIPKKKLPKEKSSATPKKDNELAATPPSNHGTTVSRTQEEILELVRKATHELGKEAATHRFTQTEKRHTAEIVYTYKIHGIRTSENEITRIAVNYIVEDYRANGENSLLHRVLKDLNK